MFQDVTPVDYIKSLIFEWKLMGIPLHKLQVRPILLTTGDLFGSVFDTGHLPTRISLGYQVSNNTQAAAQLQYPVTVPDRYKFQEKLIGQLI
jgi:hypothetical protein